MSEDPYYAHCCIADSTCSGRIEWHHNLIYAGRQVNSRFCILPLCQGHHRAADASSTKERLDRIMLNRAEDEELQEFYKADLIGKKKRLNDNYLRKHTEQEEL